MCYLFRVSIGDVVREVGVIHSDPLQIIIIVIGWVYFAAWSISFYPQVISHYCMSSIVYKYTFSAVYYLNNVLLFYR